MFNKSSTFFKIFVDIKINICYYLFKWNKKGGYNMINKMFDEKVKMLGLKFQYIANHLGITVQALRLKRIGRNQFTAKEIKKLCVLLNLTEKEKENFFF